MSSYRVFFFSSRRRHTRWTGDWSSDVCSSDLTTSTTACSPATVRRRDRRAARPMGPVVHPGARSTPGTCPVLLVGGRRPCPGPVPRPHHTTRPHDDLDVEVLRRDQHKAQRLLAGWDLRVAAGSRLPSWRDGQWLGAGANSVWCRPAPDAPWCLQLLLADSDNGNWVFRRNPAIVRPLQRIGRASCRERV